ncbi:MAG TPA: DNA polymerase ligase N-terminal domain-containing protein [Acidimicrobiales bacterium]|nr:DNA polymerase ligase N-terminal domain-containing protein [Acidimicrobiales bacterium]
MPGALGEYRRKRDFEVTSEPAGATDDTPAPTGGIPVELPEGIETGAFVIQQHDATRMHFDVRIEVGGVLRSWAVPKGPSYDPAVKRLAVPTEDHPLEYQHYEGVIPKGSYGGGPSLLWDRGSFVNISHDGRGRVVPLARALDKGHVSVWFRGQKLEGGWAFTRIEDRRSGGVTWLMVKRVDATADPERDVVTEMPRSVLSGLTVDELGATGGRPA